MSLPNSLKNKPIIDYAQNSTKSFKDVSLSTSQK